jgi:flagellar basal body rod protein FlgG
MIKGLYSAASAMLANLARQGALSHNITNLDTPGFKQIMVNLNDFKTTSEIFPPGPTVGGTRREWIGNFGLGVEPSPDVTDFTQGGLRQTGQPLDFSVQGFSEFKPRMANDIQEMDDLTAILMATWLQWMDFMF